MSGKTERDGLDALLHHVGGAHGLLEGAVPAGCVHLPAEIAVLVAVIVVGFEREPLAVLRDELRQIDYGIVVGGLDGSHQARPRHVLANGLAFHRRELGRQRLIREQAEHGLLVGQLGTEAVDHAHRAVAIRLHQRVPQVETDEELLHAKTAVDQIDFKRALAQDAVAVLELFRRDDLGGVALIAETVAEQFVFAVGPPRKATGTRRSQCWACGFRRTACTPSAAPEAGAYGCLCA